MPYTNNYPASVLYNRIALANHAYMGAQSDWARAYWDNVVDQLVSQFVRRIPCR